MSDEKEASAETGPYNYDTFTAQPHAALFSAFQNNLHAGDLAPDFESRRLEDGKTVRLSDYTAEANVILEFGSFT